MLRFHEEYFILTSTLPRFFAAQAASISLKFASHLVIDVLITLDEGCQGNRVSSLNLLSRDSSLSSLSIDMRIGYSSRNSARTTGAALILSNIGIFKIAVEHLK